MSPLEEMKARKAQADEELRLAIEAARGELIAMAAAATDATASLDHIDARLLKDHAVTLKNSAATVESRIAQVLAAARRRRTCF